MPDEAPVTPDPRDAEITRLKAIADSYAPLEGVRDALAADPGKYFAVRDALNGAPAPQPAAQPVQPAAPLSAADLAAMKQEFWDQPVQMAAKIADIARREALAEFSAEAAPIIATTSDLFIETFKSRKAAEDPMYKTIAPLFEREMGDVNRTGLLRLPPAERQRTLELRWGSASNLAFRAASEKVERERAQNLGGGSGGGDDASSKKSKSIFDRDEGLNQLAQRLAAQGLLSDEDIKNAESEMEYENS